jgi:hypothetical protein
MINYELARSIVAERHREMNARLRSNILRSDRAPSRGRNLRSSNR